MWSNYAVQAAYVHCLEQLLRKEEDCEHMKEAVAQYYRHLQAISDREADLYRQYIAEKEAWADERETLERERSKARERIVILESKLTSLHELLPDAGRSTESVNGDAKLVKALKQATRRLAQLEASTPQVMRKFNVIYSEYQCTSQAAALLESDSAEIEVCSSTQLVFIFDLYDRPRSVEESCI